MQVRFMCDSCRQVFGQHEVDRPDSDAIDGVVTLSGLCPDCNGALNNKDKTEP